MESLGIKVTIMDYYFCYFYIIPIKILRRFLAQVGLRVLMDFGFEELLQGVTSPKAEVEAVGFSEGLWMS